MRKIYILVPILILMGCERVPKDGANGTILVPVIAEASDAYATRTVLDKRDGLSYINFSAGDKIGIYDGESELKEFVTDAGGARAIFNGSIAVNSETGDPLTNTYYAVSPYTEGMTLAENAVKITIPNNQVPVSESFDPGAQFGYAQSDAKALTFSFTNAVSFAKIKVSSTEAIDLMGVVSLDGDDAITGNFSLNLIDGSLKTYDKKYKPSVQFNTELSTGTYYLALRPGTYDLEFYAETVDGKKYCNKRVSGVTFDANHSRYIIDLKDSDFIEKTDPGDLIVEGSLGLGKYLLTASAGSGTLLIEERTDSRDYRYWISQNGKSGTHKYTSYDVRLWFDEEAGKSYVLLYKKNESAPYAYMCLHDDILSSDTHSAGITLEYLQGLNGRVVNNQVYTTQFSVYKLDE